MIICPQTYKPCENSGCGTQMCESVPMVQVVEMTYDEQYEMYMKLEKSELVKMLIECNRILFAMPIEVIVTK